MAFDCKFMHGALLDVRKILGVCQLKTPQGKETRMDILKEHFKHQLRHDQWANKLDTKNVGKFEHKIKKTIKNLDKPRTEERKEELLVNYNLRKWNQLSNEERRKHTLQVFLGVIHLDSEASL